MPFSKHVVLYEASNKTVGKGDWESERETRLGHDSMHQARWARVALGNWIEIGGWGKSLFWVVRLVQNLCTRCKVPCAVCLVRCALGNNKDWSLMYKDAPHYYDWIVMRQHPFRRCQPASQNLGRTGVSFGHAERVSSLAVMTTIASPVSNQFRSALGEGCQQQQYQIIVKPAIKVLRMGLAATARSWGHPQWLLTRTKLWTWIFPSWQLSRASKVHP